jgi:serine/threonine protein kinase
MVGSLGEGAYGEVSLAVDKKTSELVAIKAVNIMRICELNKERHILREKELLDSIRGRHANIIDLKTTFKVSESHPGPSPFVLRL